MLAADDSERRAMLFVQTVAAVAAVVLSIKLGKIILNFGPPVGALELQHGLKLILNSVLFRIAAVMALAYGAGCLIAPRWRWLAAVSPILAIGLWRIFELAGSGEAVGNSWTIQTAIVELHHVGAWASLWLGLLLPLVWRDVAFLSGFALLVYTLIMVIPAWLYRTTAAALVLVVCVMFAIVGIELASYVKTGVSGSGQLLAYFLSDGGGGGAYWRSLIAGAVDVSTIGAILAPFLLGLVAARCARRLPALIPGLARPIATGMLSVSLAALLVTIGYQPALSDIRYARQFDDTFLSLRDLLPWSDSRPTEVVDRLRHEPVAFDTTAATLHAADKIGRTPRNVIVIMLESMRANATSIYNPALQTTPFLADLAKRGATVSDMYAVIPRTAAAWISILDGIYPSTNDLINRWAALPGGDERVRGLPKLLASAGYATGFVIPTRLDFEADQKIIDGMGFQWIQTADTLPTKGFESHYGGFEDRVMIDPALDWIAGQTEARHPFFLAMMTNVAHYDYWYPSTWKTRSYGDGTDGNYESYLNCVAYIDDTLREFFAGLDRLGVLKSSLIVILGDHGEAFGEHGARQHTLVPYDEALRIPMILYGEDIIAPGSSITGPRQQVDVLPTILESLGFEAEHMTAPGVSLLRPVPPDRTLYYSGSFYDTALAMRRGALKYVYYFDRTPTEVYDTTTDPGERVNIASSIPDGERRQVALDLLVWREKIRRAFIAAPGPISASR